MSTKKNIGREAVLNNGEITVDLTPVVAPAPVYAPAPVAKVQTDMGTTQTVKIRKYRLVDLSKVPAQYLMLNDSLVGKVVRAGIPEIPGIEIYEEESLRVTAR